MRTSALNRVSRPSGAVASTATVFGVTHEFSAVMVYEVGKSWAEADADTSEAIDFLEYYARQAMRLLDSSDQLAPYPAEQLSLTYIPLGVTHRLKNPGKLPLELIEVQSGSYLGEDDIVRFEDTYGRA